MKNPNLPIIVPKNTDLQKRDIEAKANIILEDYIQPPLPVEGAQPSAERVALFVRLELIRTKRGAE